MSFQQELVGTRSITPQKTTEKKETDEQAFSVELGSQMRREGGCNQASVYPLTSSFLPPINPLFIPCRQFCTHTLATALRKKQHLAPVTCTTQPFQSSKNHPLDSTKSVSPTYMFTVHPGCFNLRCVSQPVTRWWDERDGSRWRSNSPTLASTRGSLCGNNPPPASPDQPRLKAHTTSR